MPPDELQMATSRRPYLIRAIYDWVLDNGYTPYLLVAAEEPDVSVPTQYVGDDGKIVMNLSPTAVRGLDLGNDVVTFEARFSGTPHAVYIPAGAVLAVYAKETGEGMLFGDPESPESEAAGQTDQPIPGIDSVDDDTQSASDEDPDDRPPSPGGSRKRGHLTIVK